MARKARLGLLAICMIPTGCGAGHAAAPSAIIVGDTLPFPESLASSKDGAVFFGSVTKSNIYRALAGRDRAELWISREAGNFGLVTGLLVDDTNKRLLVCSSKTDTTPATVTATTVKAIDLRSGGVLQSFPFPDGQGLCNDMAIGGDGTLYATDTKNGLVARLPRGADAFETWVTSPKLATADGIAVLGDGALYVNTLLTGTLIRISANADGSAGALSVVPTPRPLDHPDGMRAVGKSQLLLVEQSGILSEISIRDGRAIITSLKTGLAEPSAVAVVGDHAYVLEAKLSYSRTGKDPGPARALAIPLKTK